MHKQTFLKLHVEFIRMAAIRDHADGLISVKKKAQFQGLHKLVVLLTLI